MKYYKILFAAAVLGTALFSSCSSGDEIRISGNVARPQGDEHLILKRLDFTAETVLDTLEVSEEGDFTYELATAGDNPGFYYLYLDGKKITSLVLKKGDRVEVRTGKDGKEVHIEGSPESLLLGQADKRLGETAGRFDSLYRMYDQATGSAREALGMELGSVFVKYKQAAIRFIYEHPRSFVNTAVVFHSFPRQLYVFSDNRDAPLLRRVYDSLYVDYPTSEYVAAVRDRYESMEKALGMENALDKAELSDFPDVCLPGLDGKTVCLSSLKGKIIVLAFWHSGNVQMRLDNSELLEVYHRYAPRGLEVYQVALDTDKTAWATMVRDQSLPWISVCDGRGIYSSAVTTYNIVEIPTYFIIQKNGDITDRLGNVNEVISRLQRLF